MPNSLFSGADVETIQRLSPEGGALATISCFLVQSNGKNILFDTGNGKADSRLLPNLASLQIQPEDIDYLFLTHFHGDHIGGMLSQDKVVFTQAEVYVPQQEYDAWMQMPADKNQQVVKTMKAYEKKLHKINGGDKLPEGVIALNAFGHTPGHTIYQVKDTLIAGDLLHGPKTIPAICKRQAFNLGRYAFTSSRFYGLEENMIFFPAKYLHIIK